MPAVSTVLIVGGGTVGCATATLLARAGIVVDLAEIKTDWTVRGSGITLMGNALRVLREVGVWPQIAQSGWGFDSARIFDREGHLLAEIPEVHTGGPDLPPSLGMTRPQLADILACEATSSGAKVRLGVSVAEFDDDGDGVAVRFTDGDVGRYDLVVGADGIHSKVRSMIGVTAGPQPTGLGVWRTHARRPAAVQGLGLCYSGPMYLAGYTPTSQSTLYTFLVDDYQDKSALDGQAQLNLLHELAAPYGGCWPDILADTTDPAAINYTPMESLLVAAPWHRGRVVLVGDAVHACPPTLAQGAAQGLEDAAVLCGMLLSAEKLDDALLQRFVDRRYPRARRVVEGSTQICQWMLTRDHSVDIAGFLRAMTEQIARPA